MTTLRELEDAFNKAYEAGNLEDARLFASEIDKQLSLSNIEDTAQQEEESIAGSKAKELAGEIGVEIALSTAGQVAAASSGVFYLPVAFGTGFGASVAAQKTIGDPDVSYGRALVNGVVNLIPMSQQIKGVLAGGKITKEVVKEVAKTEAKRGAAIGVGEATAVSVIDEGRLPTAEELLMYGVGGAGFGAALGAATPRIAQSFNKFLGKTPQQIDEDIATGKISKEDAVNAASPAMSKEEAEKFIDDTIASMDRKSAAKTIMQANDSDEPSTWQRAKAWFTPSKIIGGDATNAAFELRSKINAEIDVAAKIGRSVDDAIAKTPSIEPSVNKFLETGVLDKKLVGTKIAGDLEKYAEVREGLQRKLIQQLDDYNFEGVPLKQQRALRNTLQESIRDKNYNTREYRLFTDSKFKVDKKLQKEATEEVAQKIQAESKTKLTDAEAMEKAEEHIQKLLSHSAAAKSKNSNVHIPTATDGVLKFRHDVGEAERKFLGEITDAGERMRGTLTGLSRIVYKNEADIEVAKGLTKMGLARDANTVDPNKFTKLTLRGGIKTDLAVPNIVQDALNRVYLKNYTPEFNDDFAGIANSIYQQAISTSKAAKVLFNPPSYMVNAMGGWFTMIAMGMNPIHRGYGQGLKLATAEYKIWENVFSKGSQKARKELLDEMRDMKRYGLSAANIIESDIRDAFTRGGVFDASLGKVIQQVGKAYSATDTAARFSVWKHNQTRLAKLYPDLKGEDLKVAAARLTNDTFQNYDKLSPQLRQASRYGAMPQFVSFTAEFARNITNQVRYAKQMVAGNFGREFGLDPSKADLGAMRREGALRLASLAVVAGGGEALRRTINSSQGVTPEKEEALRNSIVPDWDKNKSLVFTEMSEDGKTGKYLNMAYLIPHSMMADIVNAAISGQPLENMSSLLAEHFVGDGTFVTIAGINALQNRDENGKQISTTADPNKAAFERLKYFFNEAFSLGAQREYGKLVQAMQDEKVGEEGKLTVGDVLRRQVGLRVNNFDIGRSATSKAKIYRQAAIDSASEYNTARDYKNLPPDELEALYIKGDNARKSNMQKIAEINRDLQKLGYSESERIQALKDAKVSSKDILATLEGTYNPLPRDKTLSTSDILSDEKFQGLSPRDTIRMIIEEAGDDINLRKRLLNQFKANLKAERRGLSDKDSLIKNMSTSERVDYIIANPQRFQEFRRKGIVNRAVMIELRRRGVQF